MGGKLDSNFSQFSNPSASSSGDNIDRCINNRNGKQYCFIYYILLLIKNVIVLFVIRVLIFIFYVVVGIYVVYYAGNVQNMKPSSLSNFCFICIGYRSYITIIKELSGKERSDL